MDFGFSSEQEQLRASLAAFLAKEAPASYARAMCEDPAGTTEDAWRRTAALGWPGLTVPEAYGGSGLGLLELVILLEELGRVVHPGPLAGLVSLTVPTLLRVATEEEKQDRLARIVAGELRASIAVSERKGRWAADAIELEAHRADGGYELSGTKLFVPDARSADEVVIAARLDDGLGFFALPCDTEGLRVAPMDTIDATRKLDVVELDGVRATEDQLLGGAPRDAGVLDEIVDVAKVGLAAEMCGAADAALAMSIDYVQVREQFGRPIATFQAIQHRLADMKVMLENARSLVYYAAWALQEGEPDGRLAAAMAKAHASDCCSQVVADAIQVHGGIAFTWEHDMHLYFKRVKSAAVTYGDATENRELVASLLEL